MADGRQIEVWETYASQCKQANRTPIVITEDNWFAQKLAQLKDIHTVLDIGCGPGNWANLFCDYNYYAFDQSPSMLQLVKDYLPGTTTVLGNARTLSEYFEAEKFDMCFSSAVLQHNRHYPDKEDIVKGMYYILKPGGYYMCAENTFISSVTPECLDNNSYTDGNSFTSIGWELFMKQYGFKLIEYKQLNIAYESAVPTPLYLFQKE